MENKLIVIIGPSASGKTALAIEMAKWLGTEIISADSRQVFREMNIGTAKPSIEQLKAVRHHLIGNVSITEKYNAGRFEKDALACLSAIFKYNQYALLVGGSGLYINALCHGLDELPDSDPEIRDSLVRRFRLHGIEFLQDALKKADPEYYTNVDLANPNRLIRALEVFEITGMPYSAFRKGVQVKRDFDILKLGLAVPRDKLISRINERTDKMMQDGLLEEVKSLLPFRSSNALNTVGYKELFDYLDGKYSLEEAVEKIKINTRRYAKRQMTWFRRDQEIVWFDPENEDGIKNLMAQ
jgi:tRNA dimethylallyltransferase